MVYLENIILIKPKEMSKYIVVKSDYQFNIVDSEVSNVIGTAHNVDDANIIARALNFYNNKHKKS